jgi:hypothetical protein
MRGVDAHHQRAVIELGELDSGRGSETRLADSALTAE